MKTRGSYADENEDGEREAGSDRTDRWGPVEPERLRVEVGERRFDEHTEHREQADHDPGLGSVQRARPDHLQHGRRHDGAGANTLLQIDSESVTGTMAATVMLSAFDALPRVRFKPRFTFTSREAIRAGAELPSRAHYTGNDTHGHRDRGARCGPGYMWPTIHRRAALTPGPGKRRDVDGSACSWRGGVTVG